VPHPIVRQRVGAVLRWPSMQENRVRHRLFGVNVGRQFGTELMMSERGDLLPLFSAEHR
jgi:hypothetical protein